LGPIGLFVFAPVLVLDDVEQHGEGLIHGRLWRLGAVLAVRNRLRTTSPCFAPFERPGRRREEVAGLASDRDRNRPRRSPPLGDKRTKRADLFEESRIVRKMRV
jgi:hypothetical protein